MPHVRKIPKKPQLRGAKITSGYAYMLFCNITRLNTDLIFLDDAFNTKLETSNAHIKRDKRHQSTCIDLGENIMLRFFKLHMYTSVKFYRRECS